MNQALKISLNLKDGTLFGNEAGEEEDDEVLSSYFLDQIAFEEFFERNQRLRFARGRKGMGKSALLAKLAYDLERSPNDYTVVRVAGSDLTGLGEFSSPDPAMLVNQWQQVICARITQEIGKSIDFAVSDREMIMVEASEIAGLKDRNLFRALLDRLTIKINRSEIHASRLISANTSELLRRHQDSNDRSVWLLVDDVDSTFIDRPDQRLKLGTFFSACRKIAREVKGLNIRCTVRTDVWSVIRHNEDLDKCEQYMTDIRWTKDEMGVMLAKRIHAYLKRNSMPFWQQLEPKRDVDKLIEMAFKRRVKWSGSRVPPIQVLNILSARRPRWLAQLCGRAGREAARLNEPLIDSQHLQAVLKKFGELRLNDLYKEHGHQFSGLMPLVQAFSGGERVYETGNLLDRIQKKYLSVIVKGGVPKLEGSVVVGPLQLAKFLFKIGFIQGHSQNDQFIDYEEKPDLLESEVNLDDGLSWAVYPSYRNVLRIR